MNCILQCLFHIDDFRDSICNNDRNEDLDDTVSALKIFFEELQESDFHIMNPKKLK